MSGAICSVFWLESAKLAYTPNEGKNKINYFNLLAGALSVVVSMVLAVGLFVKKRVLVYDFCFVAAVQIYFIYWMDIFNLVL
jgi:hypothetical protein